MGATDGYFPRGESVLRQVHDERIVGLLYGQRGLMVGAVDPVVATGTFEISRGTETPFDRLARTAQIFEITFFGSKAEADVVLERVHNLHSRVKGELSKEAGPYPAGTRYDAHDPQQMLWTLGCIADSAQVIYELLVRRLSEREREAFWRDYVRWGGLFGLPAEHMPSTYGEFRAWFDRRMAGDELHLTDEAKEIGRIVALEIPGPPYARPGLQVANLLVMGSLPKRVREMYGLRWTRAHRAAFAAAVRAHRAVHPITPNRLRRGSCADEYKLVARSENRYGRRQAQRTAAAAAAAKGDTALTPRA